LKLVADENVDRQIVEALRIDGHEVIYVAEVSPTIPDDEVLRLSSEESAVLITADKDFGELVFRQRQAAHGVILIRLTELPSDLKVRAVLNVISNHAEELIGFFTVVTPKSIRIRRTTT